MKVYISGPMSGYVNNNEEAFNVRKAEIQALGHQVVSPIDLDKADGQASGTLPPYECLLKRDLIALCSCDAITMLEGWQRSKGASLERYVALQLKIEEIDKNGKAVPAQSILEEAQTLIGGDRSADYGPPSKDFERSARLISAILGHEVTKEQIPLIMICIKLSRECNRHKRDNLVDICGYAGTLAMIYRD